VGTVIAANPKQTYRRFMADLMAERLLRTTHALESATN
jgi:uncharacterized protein (DUF488 family)